MPKKNAANDAPDTATTEPGGSALESSLPKRPKIQFVYLDSADGSNSAVSRKIARSYAARESHARVRRERLLKYQKSKGSEPEASHATAKPSSRDREEQTTAAVALQRGRGGVMKPASPITLLSAAPTDPFASTARPVALLEHYMLDHYINVVVGIGCFSTPSFPNPDAYLRGTKTEWIPLALTDPGMLDGILISACRSLHALHGNGPYLKYALQYRASCLASLNKAISKDGDNPRDSSIASAIILAADEVVMGDLLTGKQHIEAAQQMVALKGSLAAPVTSGFLRGVVETFSLYERTEAEATVIYSNYSYIRGEDHDVAEVDQPGFSDYASCA